MRAANTRNELRLGDYLAIAGDTGAVRGDSPLVFMINSDGSGLDRASG